MRSRSLVVTDLSNSDTGVRRTTKISANFVPKIIIFFIFLLLQESAAPKAEPVETPEEESVKGESTKEEPIKEESNGIPAEKPAEEKLPVKEEAAKEVENEIKTDKEVTVRKTSKPLAGKARVYKEEKKHDGTLRIEMFIPSNSSFRLKLYQHT